MAPRMRYTFPSPVKPIWHNNVYKMRKLGRLLGNIIITSSANAKIRTMYITTTRQFLDDTEIWLCTSDLYWMTTNIFSRLDNRSLYALCAHCVLIWYTTVLLCNKFVGQLIEPAQSITIGSKSMQKIQ